MKRTSDLGIKVLPATRVLIRMGAAAQRCTQAGLVDAAVAEYLANHRDELEAGIDRARETLGLASSGGVR